MALTVIVPHGVTSSLHEHVLNSRIVKSNFMSLAAQENDVIINLGSFNEENVYVNYKLNSFLGFF